MPYTEKLPSGRYRARYLKPDGTKASVKGTFAGKREAQRAAIEAEGAAHAASWRGAESANRTWGEWCDEWWPTRSIENSTAERQYTQRVKHIDDRWRSVPLNEITREDVRAWAMSLVKEKGLSKSSAQKLALMMSSSFSAAIDKGILLHNPAARLKIAGAKVNHNRYLTVAEQERLVGTLQRDVDIAIVKTLLGAGLRWGEAAGLQVNRVDVERKQLRIVEVWDSRARRLKAYPKDAHWRAVPIPEWVMQPLLEQIDGRTSGPVFEHRGYKIEYSNWRSKVWLPAIERARIAPLRIHDLRHTYASMLIQAGFSLAEVGQLLGHADPSTTQIYAHLLDPNGDRVRDALAWGATWGEHGANRNSPTLAPNAPGY